MSSLNTSIHHLLGAFLEQNPFADGIIDLKINHRSVDSQDLYDQDYLVAKQKVSFLGRYNFRFERPGGGFLAGLRVQIMEASIHIKGTTKHPVHVVGLEGIFLRGDHLVLSNVIFCCLKNKSVLIVPKHTSSITRVAVVFFELQNNKMIECERHEFDAGGNLPLRY